MSGQHRSVSSISKLLEIFGPVLRHVFRVQVSGIENIGERNYVFVANHNIGAAFEIAALLDAWHVRFGETRSVFGLAHRFVFRIPWLNSKLRKVGVIPANYDDAYRTLDAGDSLIIFPGGAYEVTRPIWEHAKCEFAGHKGWARIALAKKVPLIPIAIAGAHLVNPVLIRGEFLSWLFVLPKILGVAYFTISVAQILYPIIFYFALSWILPTWLMIVSLYLLFHIAIFLPVWPAKIKISIGEPIDLNALAVGALDSEHAATLAYRKVTAVIQNEMNKLNTK